MAIEWPFPRRTAVQGWELNLDDNVIRSTSENGYDLSRKRFSRTRWAIEDLKFEMANEDVVILRDFYYITTQSGTLPFRFVMPLTGRTEVIDIPAVKFTRPIKPTYMGLGCYSVSIGIREV